MICNGETVSLDVAPPYFAIDDGQTDAIARYEDGSVAVAVNSAGNSFYVAVPFVSSAVLREIVDRCGIFRYSHHPNVYTYVNASTVGVYNATGEDAVVSLRRDGRYRDLLTGERFYCTDGKMILPLREIRAYLLLRDD